MPEYAATDRFAVLSHKTGSWYFHKGKHPEMRSAMDQAKRFSEQHPEGKFDVIRLYGSLFEEHNAGLPPEQHLLIPRQEVIATYGPLKEEHLSDYHLVCSCCGNEDQEKFHEALVQGGILCHTCGHARVVKQRKEEVE